MSREQVRMSRTWQVSRDLRLADSAFRVRLFGWSLIGLMLVCVPVEKAQSAGGNGGTQGAVRQQQSFPPKLDPFAGDAYDATLTARRVRALNMERQKELVSDTNKLLKLARELNAEVAAQRADALTSDQLHKLSEIEKLAKSVKQRMAIGVGQTQPALTVPPILYP